jgi:hypothetical protein
MVHLAMSAMFTPNRIVSTSVRALVLSAADCKRILNAHMKPRRFYLIVNIFASFKRMQSCTAIGYCGVFIMLCLHETEVEILNGVFVYGLLHFLSIFCQNLYFWMVGESHKMLLHPKGSWDRDIS